MRQHIDDCDSLIDSAHKLRGILSSPLLSPSEISVADAITAIRVLIGDKKHLQLSAQFSWSPGKPAQADGWAIYLNGSLVCANTLHGLVEQVRAVVAPQSVESLEETLSAATSATF